jgi:molybdopterin/thiamine biosynthesis adenylyltransferase
MEVRTTRFSGLPWASELRSIMLVGCGGINSWVTLSLGRIGHTLTIVDPDLVDETNVHGGQMFRTDMIGHEKVHAVVRICRSFGCDAPMDGLVDLFSDDLLDETTHIVICGLDNMRSRRLVFEAWRKNCAILRPELQKEAILLDGRLTGEMYEVFTIPFADPSLLDRYEKDHLFSDEEAEVLDCTTKQSTGAAMGIAAAITFSLCNHLTNIKLGEEFRSVEFYQRMHYPIQQYTNEPAVNHELCQQTEVVEA